jgi:hypothetical protein
MELQIAMITALLLLTLNKKMKIWMALATHAIMMLMVMILMMKPIFAQAHQQKKLQISKDAHALNSQDILNLMMRMFAQSQVAKQV